MLTAVQRHERSRIGVCSSARSRGPRQVSFLPAAEGGVAVVVWDDGVGWARGSRTLQLNHVIPGLTRDLTRQIACVEV
jgi:hypothetical protein